MLNQAETVETLTNMQTAQSAALVGSSISDWLWLFNWIWFFTSLYITHGHCCGVGIYIMNSIGLRLNMMQKTFKMQTGFPLKAFN